LPDHDYRPDRDEPGGSNRKLLLMILWLFTLALPPMLVLALPVTAKAIMAGYYADVPIALAITWC
jgi:hypothetical protein